MIKALNAIQSTFKSCFLVYENAWLKSLIFKGYVVYIMWMIYEEIDFQKQRASLVLHPSPLRVCSFCGSIQFYLLQPNSTHLKKKYLL